VPSLPRNADVADRFDELADVSEILGEQGFRVLAYRRAATRIRETGASVAELALAGSAKELSGIGATIEAKIVELTETGAMEALEKRRAEVPDEVTQFLRLPGLGPKTAARIWQELGVTTLEGLREAAEQQRVRTLQGLGAKSEEKILEALEKGFGPEPEKRGLLAVGLPVVRDVVAALREHPASVEVSEAGSVRRGRETFRDLDVIATATDAKALIGHFVTLPWVLEVAARGDTKATIETKQGIRIDLRVVPPEDFGSLLQHFTGSKDHNIALREEAQRRGLSISEYGVTVVETGAVHRFAAEDALYRFLGYDLIPPELRENGGELLAARDGHLPALVEVSDLVGELHCHSTWSSDGKASIEQMAVTARDRGYKFLALTDHSHYLRDGRMEAQWEEIDRVNERLGQFRVLRGVEANIRANGEVDVDEGVLATLDWVVASLHGGFDRNPTERILAAIDHPHVDCIGHLTGRKLNRRPGADIDVERVIARAVEARTALEINSQPDRLDMRDVHARLAGEAGVLIPITTDAHSAGALGYAELGVAQARRAWLTKAQVLNTRPWREIAKLRP
jgi:DNA polymerase (family X)